MSIENILNNNQYKSIFLKAILLGINYGRSNNVNYYINNIEKEISELNEILKNENKLNEFNEIKINSYKVLEKYEKNILILDNQKKYTFGLIQSLTVNNYAYNYPKINILKNNLIIINNEIEKNKILLKKNKDIIDKKIENIQLEGKKNNQNIKSIKNNNLFKELNNDKNLVGELEKTLGNLSNFLIN
jgi:hypothetical protein